MWRAGSMIPSISDRVGHATQQGGNQHRVEHRGGNEGDGQPTGSVAEKPPGHGPRVFSIPGLHSSLPRLRRASPPVRPESIPPPSERCAKPARWRRGPPGCARRPRSWSLTRPGQRVGQDIPTLHPHYRRRFLGRRRLWVSDSTRFAGSGERASGLDIDLFQEISTIDVQVGGWAHSSTRRPTLFRPGNWRSRPGRLP
jgi:hypothetical protein